MKSDLIREIELNSNIYYKKLFEQSKDAIFIADVFSKKIVDVNKAAELLVGRKKSELLGKSHLILHPPQDKSKYSKMFLHHIKKKVGIEFEVEVQHKSGAKIPVSIYATLIEFKRFRLIKGVFQDITKIKDFENQLKAKESEIKSITDNALDSIFIKDKDRVYTFVNPAMEKLLGLPSSKIIGKTAKQIFDKNSSRKIDSVDKKNLQGKNVNEIHELIIAGNSHFFHTLQVPIKDENDQIVGISGIVRDITQEKLNEEAFKIEKEKVEKYLQLAGTIMVALDKDARITLINKKGNEVLGYENDDLIGKDWFQCCVPITIRKEVKSVFNKIIKGQLKLVENYENKIITRNKEEKIINWHNTIIKDHQGRVHSILSSGEDITEKKKAEEKLKESEERYRIITRQTGHLIYDYDIISGNINWYGAIKDCTGYSYQEFQKINFKKWGQLIHPEDRLEAFKLLKKAQIKKSSYYAEYRLKKKNGQYDFFSDEGVFIFSSDVKDGKNKSSAKKNLRMLGTMKNISERKNYELLLKKSKVELEEKVKERTLQLSESEERYRVLFEKSTDAIMLLSPETLNFLKGNTSTLKLFGLKDEKELLISGPIQLSPKRQPNGKLSSSEAKKMIAIARKTGSHYFEWKHKKKNGLEFFATVLLTKISLGHQSLILVTVRDITNKKIQEQEVEKAKEQLIQKVKELERFTNIAVSRELKMVKLKKKLHNLEDKKK